MNMGKRIEEELIRREWSRSMLYELVPGLDDGTLSAIIKRDSKLSKFAPAIAHAFGVELHWLLTGEGVKFPQERRTKSLKSALSLNHQILIRAFNCASPSGQKMMLALARVQIQESANKRKSA